MYQVLGLTGSQPVEFNEPGDFFRIMDAQYSMLVVAFYRAGREVARAEWVGKGYAEKFDQPFDRVVITSVASQTVSFVSRLGNEVRYDTPPSGDVNVIAAAPTRATGANSQKTVTNASAQLVAANAARSYLLIQNNDATGIVYVAFGAAATTANGIKIPPGGSYELNCNILTAAVNAIGSIASNANVVVVEG